MRTYYLPINSQSLAHYFGSACIKPAKYFSNKPADVQNKFEEYILLSEKIGAQDANCCLEIVFKTEEIEEMVSLRRLFSVSKATTNNQSKENLFFQYPAKRTDNS